MKISKLVVFLPLVGAIMALSALEPSIRLLPDPSTLLESLLVQSTSESEPTYTIPPDTELVNEQRGELNLTSMNPQRVQVGELFSIKIILTAPSDIIILSHLDKTYLEDLNFVRLEEEVFFTFRAKKIGQTEIIFDRLTTTLETKYFAHSIIIRPRQPDRDAPAPLSPVQARPEAEAEAEQEALFNLVQGWIASKDVPAAERAFLTYASDFASDFPYRINVILNLANLYLEKEVPQKALTLLRAELKQNSAAMEVKDRRRLKISIGYLERVMMDYERSLQTWLELKRALQPTSAETPRVLFELGETLFAAKQYGAAHSEYTTLLNHYKTQKISPPAEYYFLILYHLANIYETDPALRDYEQSYHYYLKARDFYETTLETEAFDLKHYEDEQQLIRERIQFISDHFIRIR